eukprot:CAMPEP_0117443846 /NCGR_PEP_ID=MMETSP0759-20121206/4920_1 /TAXON_ID=63605 /ORGANISM="Percolomonas cosmopolitus, Strain WS" /LENGTH=2244 /DNA_ID=CAMNT_0005235863 /DNA_START=115 /DNA_END=6846 /DNA_ORIENTATION=-
MPPSSTHRASAPLNSGKRKKRDLWNGAAALSNQENQSTSTSEQFDPLAHDIHAHYYDKSARFHAATAPAPHSDSAKRPLHSSQSTRRPQIASNLQQQLTFHHNSATDLHSTTRRGSALRNKLGLPQRSSSAMSHHALQDHDSASHRLAASTPQPTSSLIANDSSMLPTFAQNQQEHHQSTLFKNNYVSSPLSPIPHLRERSSSNASSTDSGSHLLPQTAYDVLFNTRKPNQGKSATSSARPLAKSKPPKSSKSTKPKKSKSSRNATLNGKSSKKSKTSKREKIAPSIGSRTPNLDPSTQIIYAKSKERILRLWDELRIPHQERAQIADKCFVDHPHDVAPKTISKLSKYTEKLMQHRQNTLHVLKQIDIREAYLAQLRDLVEAFEERNILNYAALTQQVVQLISKIRLATLDTVEAIVEWRRGLTVPKPFIWKTNNYLLKIQRDLDFFRQSSLSNLVEGGDESSVGSSNDGTGGDVDSPSVAHGDLSGGEESFSQPKLMDSNNSTMRRSRNSLPPLKMTQSVPSGKLLDMPIADEFLRRIQNAAHVITNESNLSESVLNQLKSSSGYIPTLKDATPVSARHYDDTSEASSLQGASAGIATNTGMGIEVASKKFLSKIKKKPSTKSKKQSKLQKSPSPTQKRRKKTSNYESAPLEEEIHSPLSVGPSADLQLLEERERASATAIQATFRGYLERKNFFLFKQSRDLCNECALRIQQAWRAHVARQSASVKRVEQAERQRSEYEAARTIQSAFRVQKSKKVFQKRKQEFDFHSNKATIIQSAWRGILGRRDAENYGESRSEYTLHLQSVVRALLAQHEYGPFASHYNGAATKIQSLFRGYKDRKEWSPHLGPLKNARTRAAIDIQRSYRGYASRQQTEQWIYERERSVGVISPAVKQFLAKLSVQKRRRAEEMEIERELERENAALTIQRATRGLIGRNTARHERLRHGSATLIQSVVRRWRDVKWVNSLRDQQERMLVQFLCQEVAALSLQAHFRRVLSKRYFEEVKKTKNAAATNVQRVYRAHLARKFAMQWKSAIFLQRHARVWIAKESVRQIAAARRIEAVALGWFARKHYPKLLEAYHDKLDRGIEQEEATLLIQRCARVFLSKKYTQRTRNEFLEQLILNEQQEKAALQIQRMAKGHLSRQRVHQLRHELPLHRAAKVIQSAARIFLSKNRALLLRAEKHRLEQEFYERELPLRKLQTVSAIQIQRVARGYLARQKVLRRPYDQAAEAIQQVARDWLSRVRASRQESATYIQSHWRSHIARKEYRQMHTQMHSAAILIQREARVLLAQRFLEKTRAAIQIQRVVRGKIGRKYARARHDEMAMEQSALKIQTVVRQFLAKLFVEKWCASKIIQRAYRVHRAKTRIQRMRKENEDFAIVQRHTAATQIQRMVRGYHARHVVKDYKQRANRASLIVQGQARIFLAKKFALKEKSARTLQGCAKQFLAKRHASELKMLQEQTIVNVIRREHASLMIQKIFRGHIVRQHVANHRKITSKKDAAMRIQRCVKTYFANKHMLHLREIYEHEMQRLLIREGAALTIQKNARVLLARGYAQRYKINRTEFESARCIQMCVRIVVAKNRIQQLKSVQKNSIKILVQQEIATVELQRVARGFLDRRRVKSIRQLKTQQEHNNKSALIIQGAWNGFLDRRDVRGMLWTVVLMQSCMRSLLSQNRIDRREGATLTIQAYYRAYRARIVLNHQKKAARLITSAAKAHLRYKNINAIKIQSVMRSCLSRKRRRAQCVVLIQSQIRSFLQQLRYNELLMNIAALVIQKNFKAFHMRSMSKTYVSELQDENKTSVNGVIVREYAALTIQCAWRQRLARKSVNNHENENVSASVLQRAWRLHCARNARRQLEERREKVQLVQNRVRQILGFLAFNDRLALDVLDYADSLIGEQQESIKIQSVVKIQRAVRPFLARRIMDRKRQEKREQLHKRVTDEWYSSKRHINSVFNVQHCARRNIAFIQVAYDQHLRGMFNSSAQKIQLCYKLYKARRLLLALRRQKRRESEFEQRQEANSILVQSVFRRLQSQHLTEDFRREFLVERVQRMIHAQLARYQTGLLKARQDAEQRKILREVSAGLIQRNFKAHKAKREFSRLRRIKDEKEARTIGNAQKILLAKREYQFTAPSFAAHVAREDGDDVELFLKKEQVASHMNALEDTAALRIQTMFRQFNAWKQFQNARKQYYESIEEQVKRDSNERNAITIQRAIRFHLANNVVQQRKQQMEDEERRELELEQELFR